MESRAQAAEALISKTFGKDALANAIQAADLYMRAATEENISKSEATRLRRKCQHLITYAESLKAQLAKEENPDTIIDGVTDEAMHAVSQTPAELEILRIASYLHGSFYPPWNGQPPQAEFQLNSSIGLYKDQTAFSLSAVQKETFEAWRRPAELFDLSSNSSGNHTSSKHAEQYDLVQDVTTDCSVVASLSAAAPILMGKHKALASVFYPFDHTKNQPGISFSGKYVFCMNFNGCTRRVVIDDRLPASRTERKLFVTDRSNSLVFWPALLEKAYLKIRGGYDFPGSNSNTDLWVLIGWIPEQIFIQRDDFSLDEFWQRLEDAYEAHNVIVTLGTSRLSREEELILGLVGEHDYAVQGLRCVEGSRKLLIKNPWLPNSTTGETSRGLTAALKLPSSLEAGDTPITSRPSTFWLTFEEVAQNFESIYLNWNPALFAHCRHHHFSWDIPPERFRASLVRNPQFSLVCHEGGLIWVLVSRHFMDAEVDIARSRSSSLVDRGYELGFMNVAIYENGGHRVHISDNHLYCGPFVNSPQTLARFESTPEKLFTVVIDQQQLPLAKYTFTLSVFSSNPTKLEIAKKMPYCTEAIGAWNRRTAGGNSSCSTYYLNPQYKLCLTSSSEVSVVLSTDKLDVHVHLNLLWQRVERGRIPKAKDLIASSGEYRRGCALISRQQLDVGTYVLVCSTFAEGQIGGFALQVESTLPVTILPVPVDVAGRLQTSLNTLTITQEHRKWRTVINVSWLSRISVSIHRNETPLHIGTPLSRSGLRIRATIIYQLGRERKTIVESNNGEFYDLTNTIQTPEVDIEPSNAPEEQVWLVVEAIGFQSSAIALQAEIFSDSRIQVGNWQPL